MTAELNVARTKLLLQHTRKSDPFALCPVLPHVVHFHWSPTLTWMACWVSVCVYVCPRTYLCVFMLVCVYMCWHVCTYVEPFLSRGLSAYMCKKSCAIVFVLHQPILIPPPECWRRSQENLFSLVSFKPGQKSKHAIGQVPYQTTLGARQPSTNRRAERGVKDSLDYTPKAHSWKRQSEKEKEKNVKDALRSLGVISQRNEDQCQLSN